MGQSLQGVIGQEKGVGAGRLMPQACSFYVGVNAAGAWATSRPVVLSGSTGVEVRLDLKDG
ncbi:Sea20 [Serratia sp. FS14]|nr:Sea20 [Serratia sp. FS14]